MPTEFSLRRKPPRMPVTRHSRKPLPACHETRSKGSGRGLNLGNLLRDARRTVEAEAAYRWAVKADPNFAPAWHNLADPLDESGSACRGG